ncbi:MAG: TipAS antibiotic-recognition domain-containing protein [Clostridiales bacterium]|nr:TipAS antibiotic-recognition domain-containing protein [Clostridiales bacterium]
MHKKWIKQYWNFYSKGAHIGLVTMYFEDERFKYHYDQIEKDLAYFIRNAMTE